LPRAVRGKKHDDPRDRREKGDQTGLFKKKKKNKIKEGGKEKKSRTKTNLVEGGYAMFGKGGRAFPLGGKGRRVLSAEKARHFLIEQRSTEKSVKKRKGGAAKGRNWPWWATRLCFKGEGGKDVPNGKGKGGESFFQKFA